MSDIDVLAIQLAEGISIPELHGSVSGLVVRHYDRLEAAVDRGFQLLEGRVDPDYLDPFVTAIAESLLDPDMGFAPILEDPSSPLAVRIAELSQWVIGFVAGYFYMVDESYEKISNSEVKEILDDFLAIAEIDSAQQDSEESEAEFVHVYEFVRVGALLIMESSGEENNSW